MPAAKPDILLVNAPVPVPSDVFVSNMVGFCVVPQHTPFTVTGTPPSEVTFPPPEAEVEEVATATDVVTFASAGVVNTTSAP